MATSQSGFRGLHGMGIVAGRKPREMQRSGLLRRDADAATLAEAVMAILQGGYLLSATKRDPRSMRSAVQVAMSHLGSFRPTS